MESGKKIGRFEKVRVTIVGLLLIAISVCVTAMFMRTPRITLVVTTRSLSAGAIIGTSDVQLHSVPWESAPRHSLRGIASAVGHRLSGPIAAGDALSVERVAVLPRMRNVMQMSMDVDSATAAALAPADVVDLWSATAPDDFSGGRAAQLLAHAVRVIGVTRADTGLRDGSVLLDVGVPDIPAVVAAKAAGSALLLTRQP